MAFSVKIKRWQAVGVWTWDAGDDVCGICCNPYDGCAQDAKYPGDDSPVVWGACGHAFHLQCIQKWLAARTEQRCPMCRRQWEFKVANATQATR
jgi:anaphase-promoting complex subunit 11